MTDDTNAQVPAGWYPDPSSGGRTRWWDGAAWTEHFAGGVDAAPGGGVPTVGAYGSYVAPSKAPEGTATATPFIWIIIALPLVSLVGTLTFDVEAYIESAFAAQTSGLPPYADPGYILLQVSGWLFYLATALLAFFDWRALGKAGVPRPFFWAWSFLGGIVYVIGRSVVVRRRTGGGLAPLWAFIAVYVVVFAVAIAHVASGMSAALRYLQVN
jgi:hypothetical protein